MSASANNYCGNSQEHSVGEDYRVLVNKYLLLVNKYCAKIIKMLHLSEHFTVLHRSVTFTPLQGNCYNTGEGKEDLDVTAFEARFVNEDTV